MTLSRRPRMTDADDACPRVVAANETALRRVIGAICARIELGGLVL